ncbi:MAG TPA: CPCC family cysteine-rich protein [Blastocatellia bacterium]|nr:CPCC family cysteine-rich protein [Blastocatellia bacterium]
MNPRRVSCPCCGFLTLTERSAFELCPVCFWEDDGQDNADADDNRGGPTSSSLTEARRNFRAFGACDQRALGSVRPPNSDEIPATA